IVARRAASSPPRWNSSPSGEGRFVFGPILTIILAIHRRPRHLRRHPRQPGAACGCTEGAGYEARGIDAGPGGVRRVQWAGADTAEPVGHVAAAESDGRTGQSFRV